MNIETPLSNEDFGVAARRQLKNEARVTSGMGKGHVKDKNLGVFWNEVWPKLTEAGWTKVEQEGVRAGSVLFLPKGSTIGEKGGLVSGDHYERIRDVLDRLEEGRSQTEAAIANLYLSLHHPVPTKDATKTAKASSSPKAGTKRKSIVTPKLDLSWKKGGVIFARKSSRVGKQHQVTEIPKAGTFDPSESLECSKIWDPKEASPLFNADGELALLDDVPKDKREEALLLLNKQNYVPGDNFLDTVNSTSSWNGADWPAEKKRKFSESVFKFRKDLNAIRDEMGIDMASCLGHYYGVFKHTDDYRLVKTVLLDERMDKKTKNATPQAGEPDLCLICDDGGQLLICDGCEGEYHLKCCDPALKEVPEGYWECDECVNKKVLAFRDYLVRQSGLFDAKDSEQDGGPIAYVPTSSALQSIRKMAKGISALMTPKTSTNSDVTMKVEDAPTVKEESLKNDAPTVKEEPMKNETGGELG